MLKEGGPGRSNAEQDNYRWEEGFNGNNPASLAAGEAATEHNLDPAAILQKMLKGTAPDETDAAEGASNLTTLAAGQAERTAADQAKRSDTAILADEPAPATVCALLELAAEAEHQAQLTLEAADTANELAADLLHDMQHSGETNVSILNLSRNAGENAILATETALQAHISAMETHAAAVNHGLGELEYAKEALQQHSREFITRSKQATIDQEAAALAREKANQARMDYAAKQNVALSSRDAMADAKKEYENWLSQVRHAQENLDLAQQQARYAHQEYLQLKQKLEARKQQWLEVQRQYPPTPPPAGGLPRGPLADPENISSESAAVPDDEQVPTAAEESGNAIPFSVADSAVLAAAPPALEEYAQDITAEELLPQLPDSDSAAPAPISWRDTKIWAYGKLVLTALILVIVLKQFVFDVVLVEGVSMLPTLHDNDHLINSKVAYWFSEPQRGDIILVEAEENADAKFYIKRIIGLPNEKITIENGAVYIDDQMLTEDYLVNTVLTDGDVNDIIPDGHYFVMGDNRPVSRDSRTDSIGYIEEKRINGKAVLRIYPFSQMSLLN